VTTERSPVTCAAFSPTAGLDASGFAVTGTKDGYVYLWDNSLADAIPTQQAVRHHRLGADPAEPAVRLSLVEKSTDAGKIRIAVDIDNPRAPGEAQYRFIPGQRLTIVVVDEGKR
jgi:hypothetical protein